MSKMTSSAKNLTALSSSAFWIQIRNIGIRIRLVIAPGVTRPAGGPGDEGIRVPLAPPSPPPSFPQIHAMRGGRPRKALELNPDLPMSGRREVNEGVEWTVAGSLFVLFRRFAPLFSFSSFSSFSAFAYRCFLFSPSGRSSSSSSRFSPLSLSPSSLSPSSPSPSSLSSSPSSFCPSPPLTLSPSSPNNTCLSATSTNGSGSLAPLFASLLPPFPPSTSSFHSSQSSSKQRTLTPPTTWLIKRMIFVMRGS
mmetsp:Transcript_21998/g.39204  ORF Transcript_21998/g.39204 Transcript_21998/m.39204 type:complete len:251 (-) Transcript_21998:277-1029(-)